MSVISDTFLGMIRKIILEEIRFSVPRLAQVVNVADPLSRARVKVLVPSIGWNTDNKAVWANPKDKNKITTPKVDDWVIVEWLDGKNNGQCVYSGIANFMKDMLPSNYDGKNTTQIVFEDNLGETFIKYDEESKVLTIEDSYNNSIVVNKDGVVVTDVNGNVITMKSGEITIEGTAIKLLGGGEAFIKGNTLDSWITSALKATFDAHVHPETGATTGPPVTPLAAPTNHLSTTIEGE